MKWSGLVAVSMTLAALSLTACNRAKEAPSSQSSPQTTTSPASPQQLAPAAATASTTAASVSPAVLSGSAGVAVADGNAPKVVVSDRTQTFTVWQQPFRLLIHTLAIEGTTDQTVEWWELRNAKDRVVYRASYPITFQNGSFESTVDISASSFNTSQGGGILIHGMDLPSAPSSGGWVHVFGFKYGRDKYGVDDSLFGSFGTVVDGDFVDVSSDSSKPNPPAPNGVTVTVMQDVLRFRLWTGNFNIVYPVLINWITGKLQPGARCMEMSSKGWIERCSYPITVEDTVRASQPTFVRLFQEPDGGSGTPKHVIVQPQSKIEYLEARVPVAWSEDSNSISFGVNGDMWVKVRIDGQEGWIHEQEDFDAVGLPQSG